jgi:hypothetical protein
MRTPRPLNRAAPNRLLLHQKEILFAVALDERQTTWAQELLQRRNAVARWRGKAGCSVRDVMRTLSYLPAAQLVKLQSRDQPALRVRPLQ